MKVFNVKFLVVAIVIAACIFVSCRKSKEAPTPESKMAGTWEGLYGNNNDVPYVYFAFIIKKDGTLQVKADEKDDPMTGTGTWTLQEDVFKAVYHYDGEDYNFNVAAKLDEAQMKITGSWGNGDKDADDGEFFMKKQ